MTPLDQAFIRAYGLHEGVPLPAIDRSIGTVPLSEAIGAQPSTMAIPSPKSCQDAAARARQRDVVGLPNRRAVDALADHRSSRPSMRGDQEPNTRRVTPPGGRISLDAPGLLGEGDHVGIEQLDLPAKVTSAATTQITSSAVELADRSETPVDAAVIELAETAPAEDCFDPPVPCEAAEQNEESAEPKDQPEEHEPAETPALQDQEDLERPAASTSAEADSEDGAATDATAPEQPAADRDIEEPVSAEEVPTPESVAPEPPEVEPFEPLLQTDRFDWPEVCREMDRQAVEPIGRLADALLACRDRGQKVVGLGGTQRGEGCTTLVLSVARQLAARGVQVILVDADVRQPEIARRLGLAPDADWRDVLAGRARLEDAVIESAKDQLAVLPCNRRSIGRGLGEGNILDDSAILGRLRAAYDVVLVDLGPLAKTSATRRLAAGGAVDTILLIHDVRTTSPRQLSRLKDRLAKAGATQAGVAENFVPGTSYRVG